MKYALVGAGALTAGTAYWLKTSNRRAARWMRVLLADARRAVLPAPVRPDPKAWPDNAITLCWIGHATMLINFFGVRILTDPAFGDRIGFRLGIGIAGPKRYVAAALRPRDLPPIDVLLLSHAHMDHMDIASLASLPRNVFTVTAKDTTDVIDGIGLDRITELGWGDKVQAKCAAGDIEIQAFEVKHWGVRWPSKRLRGYNGYILRREGKALLFAGDTAHTPLFSKIRSHGPFEAAIMPIGAYDPWIWNHCTPEQAVELADMAGARLLVPVHHQTFKLSNEPMNEPIERFEAALESERERIALRRIGESFTCPNGVTHHV